MKIWLNHTLACPDDDFYPLNLRIFTWESANDQFSSLLTGFRARNLYNFRDTDSPLTITTVEASSGSKIVKKNMDYVNEKSGIIRILTEMDKILLHDAVAITPLPFQEYFQTYLDILDEFSVITDFSNNLLAMDAFNLIREISSNFHEKKLKEKIKPNSVQELEKQLAKILQELLFLNIFLTYLEIEEGLLICPHCKRWFPIIKTIPRIYPKAMKREEMDLIFLNKWKDLFPKDMVVD